MLRHLLRECVSRNIMATPRALAPWTACVASATARDSRASSSSSSTRPWTTLGSAHANNASPRPRAGFTARRAASTAASTASPRYGTRRGRNRSALLRPIAATTTTTPGDENGRTLNPSGCEPWTLLGCDSDAGGALAVVRGPSLGCVASVDVHDCPTYKVEVNGKLRKRLCVEDMVQLVTSLNIPARTTVFLEEGGVEYGFSAQTAFVQGYNFGLWKGVLAAAGLTVEVVKPQAWKHALGLARSGSSKDDSRHFAAAMFPEVGEVTLRRKKDHGRAEALLIAAYGHMAMHARGARADAAQGLNTAVLSGSDEEDPLCRRVRDMVIRAAEEASEGDGEGGEGDAHTTSSGMRRRLGPDDPLPYFGPYFGMTGKALGKECKSRGLKVSGKKMELIERLEEDDAGAVRRAREAAAAVVMEVEGREEEEERGARRAAAA